MNSLWTKHRPLYAVAFFLLLLSTYVTTAQDATEEAAVEIIVISEPFEVTFGPGPFNLLTPTAGLSDLSSYRATLTISFDGTNAGEPQQWSRTYTLLATQSPPARQLMIDDSDTGQIYRAEIDGTLYERQADGICIASAASAIEVADTPAETWEPAGFLDSVIGADEAGAETVNNIAASHYTFDERAHGALDIAESTGELWVAVDGGYLVSYQLSTMGGADYFGEGIEGTLTWDYRLADVNQPLSVMIPEDCPPGLLDVPMMPDAANIIRMPGTASYTTSASPADVLTFYQEQAAASGEQASSQPATGDTSALFGFTLGDQPLLVIASSQFGPTGVEILRLADSGQLSIAEVVPDERGDAAPAECAPAETGLPMMPDASQVQNISGMLSFMTATSVPDTIAFYEEQIAALGGQVSAPMPATNEMAMLNATINGQVSTITIMSMGGINNVIIMSTADAIAARAGGGNCAPAAPQSGTTSEPTAAAGVPSDCTVSSGSNANERSGPGTNFAVAGTLSAGTSANVDGQATGADGFIWWRLGAGIWVRSDVVIASGNCDSVPVVTS
jgi:hypothetical protein